MKTQITLLAFLFLLVNVYANNTNTQNLKSTFFQETVLVKANDTVKKKRPYHMKRGEGVVVKKIGEGNMVVLTTNNGNDSFDESVRFKSTSGYQFTSSLKKGFEGVDFPVTVELHSYKEKSYGSGSPISKADHITKIFEIQIDEPGIWEISFTTKIGSYYKDKQRGQF